jgi:ATP-dependent Clp protease protease subunit
LETLAACAKDGFQQVHLALSTSGGDVNQGVTLYNALRSMPFELITHNIGNVDSIGNAIYLGGKKRYANAHSTFMFHSIFWSLPQPTQLQLKQAVEIAESIKRENARISSIIRDQTKLKDDEIDQLFTDGETKNASSALESCPAEWCTSDSRRGLGLRP